MSAPAAPTSFTRAFTGFIDHAAIRPSFAACFTWTRSSGAPSPIEHYALENYEPDNIVSDGLGGYIHTVDVLSTGDAITRAIVDSDELLPPSKPVATTNCDGDEIMRLNARNDDGSSAQVTVSGWMSGYATRPLLASDLALATGVDIIGIGTSSATVRWVSSASETRATHWIVRIYRAALLEREFAIPFYLTELPVTGLAPGVTYTAEVFARYRATYISTTFDGYAATSAPFTTDAESGAATLSGPLSVDVVVGQTFCGTFTSPIPDTVEWNVFNGPPGLFITPRGNAAWLGDLSGTAAAAGIYDATVQSTTQSSEVAERVPYTLDVRFRVGSPLFAAWFHDDPLRRDLHLDVRTLTLSSGSDPFGETGLRLTLHDPAKFHLILHDGARILDELPTRIIATIRDVDQFDAAPLLRQVWGNSDHETVGGRDLAYLTFTPGIGDDLDAQFADLNASDDAQPASAEIPARLEITLELATRTLTTRPVPVIIAQDYDA